MNSNNLIIVPVYPPHFQWAIKLLDSASTEENISLGFSNQNDANSFNHTFPFRTLISDVPEGETGFVGKKKLNLLKQVYSEYNYIAIIDVESKFLKPTTTCLEEFWNDNCFLANHSIDGSRIVKEITSACGYNHNDDLYPWFQEIPIYKSELLPGFFKWLNEKKEVLYCFSGFDFILFSIYCRYELNMTWRTLGTEKDIAWHGANEDPARCYTHLAVHSHWSSWFPGVENLSNIHLLMHLDRFPIKQ